ncbi:MAG: hypothetical protein RBU21_24435 [FCB group bacterium]|jgi:hypothetical protein|nr:hypothetical protein [FCB group bacterium]
MRLTVRVATIAFALLLSALTVSVAVAAEATTSPAALTSPITPNEFEGSDTERINQAIAAAAATGQRVVIPKINRSKDGDRNIWLLDSAILVQSGTTLELENCHIKLSDRCRDNFIRSKNCGLGITAMTPMSDIHIVGIGSVLLEGADHPRATGDSAKTLGERTYGTDAGVANESQTGDWRNIGILLSFVERFSIENLLIKDSHSWAISLERCAFGKVRDIDFASNGSKTIDGVSQTILNQDGLDLRQGCHDIAIANITGYTGDDLVAFTAILKPDSTAGSTTSTMVSEGNNRGDGQDDIRHITLRNVRGHCANGHHIVRFLNAGGLKIHDVILDGLIDTSGTGKRCRAALKIGDSNPKWGGVTPLGDTYRIIATNIVSRAEHTVLIAGSLSESVITNVIKYEATGDPITYESGVENVRQVEISNIRTLNAPSNP